MKKLIYLLLLLLCISCSKDDEIIITKEVKHHDGEIHLFTQYSECKLIINDTLVYTVGDINSQKLTVIKFKKLKKLKFYRTSGEYINITLFYDNKRNHHSNLLAADWTF